MINEIKILLLEIYDNQIKYDGKPIYYGNVKKLSNDQINSIVENYKISAKEAT